eukprot:gb/GFBE01054029.1/.p1 GENE.gb/GFBE01054029.1/~~gb/GFBE01054029.1/.p1  ORF type:complete len:434 (+),score=38.74 gb/GFBE01054029.1/:1-1302(+)
MNMLKLPKLFSRSSSRCGPTPASKDPVKDAEERSLAGSRPATPMSSADARTEGKMGKTLCVAVGRASPEDRAGGLTAMCPKSPKSPKSPLGPKARRSRAGVEAGAEMILTPALLQDSMDRLAAGVKPWDEKEFQVRSILQEAVRNHGRVNLVDRPRYGDCVAVKTMPTEWVTRGPGEFVKVYPKSTERPWMDFGIVNWLNSVKYPYVCDMVGIFRDSTTTYAAVSLATKGDLFGWGDDSLRAGLEREALMKPLVAQILSAVRMLHDMGIAHRDLSLENVLLTDRGSEQRILLCDFGMASLSRFCTREVRGKPSYQAPEMHTGAEYDAFLSDVFAIGVTVFAMSCSDYPWTSTKTCKLFQFVQTSGMMAFMKKRKLRQGRGETLIEVLSSDLVSLINGLVQFDPAKRLTLGEQCYSSETRQSVLDAPWVQSAST